MSDRGPIRRIDWDAKKREDLTAYVRQALEGKTLNELIEINESISEPTKNVRVFGKFDSATLTLQDLKFLYDCGISCE